MTILLPGREQCCGMPRLELGDLETVKQAKGNYTEAAKSLGLHPNYLHRLIRNLNIKAELKNLF